jgi:hypothetical protein
MPSSGDAISELSAKRDAFLQTGRGFRALMKSGYNFRRDTAEQLDAFAIWDRQALGKDGKELNTKYPLTGEAREMAYMRTCCVDFMPSGQNFALEAFRAWKKERWAQKWMRKMKADHLGRAHEFLNAMSAGLPNRSDNRAFLLVLEEAMDRKLFWTGKGYLGMSPRISEKDDEIWLIQGCRVPLVLRKSARQGEYELLGDSYMHGAMYGDLFDEQKCERVALI